MSPCWRRHGFVNSAASIGPQAGGCSVMEQSMVTRLLLHGTLLEHPQRDEITQGQATKTSPQTGRTGRSKSTRSM